MSAFSERDIKIRHVLCMGLFFVFSPRQRLGNGGAAPFRAAASHDFGRTNPNGDGRLARCIFLKQQWL
jgi:hypothetical protein